MIRFMKSAVALLLSTLCVFNCFAKKEIVVGIDATSAPFTYCSENGDTTKLDNPVMKSVISNDAVAGLDIEIIEAIADETKMKVKYVHMPFPKLFEALDAHEVDLIAAGITLTPERLSKYNCTSPYAKSSLGYMYDMGVYSDLNMDGKDFLAGKKICVKRKTTSALYVVSELMNVNIRSYDTFKEVVSLLRYGACDAFVYDKPMLAHYVAMNPRESLVARALDEEATSQSYGFLFSKDSGATFDIFEAGLRWLIRSGNLENIENNYEGVVTNPYLKKDDDSKDL